MTPVIAWICSEIRNACARAHGERAAWRANGVKSDLSFTKMPPISFPQVLPEKCSISRKSSGHICSRKLPRLHAWLSQRQKQQQQQTLSKKGKNICRRVLKCIFTDFSHFSVEELQGKHSILGKSRCASALINSGRAALSVELPPQQRSTITQGRHFRSVWVWSIL